MTPIAVTAADPEQFDVRRYAPNPLVLWSEVVATEAPGQAPTRSRLRRLREHNLATGGVQVPLRGSSRVEGTATFHSALSVWSTRLRQLGLDAEAQQVRDAGSRIEQTYSRYLRAYLSHHLLEELDQADFWPRLVKDTAAGLPDFLILNSDGAVVFVGEVKARSGPTWQVSGRDGSGARREADLLSSLLAHKQIGDGALVFLTERVLGTVTVTEVERAVPVPSDKEIAEGPPFDDEEYGQLAARYRRTGGRLPDPSERRELAVAHAEGSIPRRTLTPKQ